MYVRESGLFRRYAGVIRAAHPGTFLAVGAATSSRVISVPHSGFSPARALTSSTIACQYLPRNGGLLMLSMT